MTVELESCKHWLSCRVVASKFSLVASRLQGGGGSRNRRHPGARRQEMGRFRPRGWRSQWRNVQNVLFFFFRRAIPFDTISFISIEICNFPAHAE